MKSLVAIVLVGAGSLFASAVLAAGSQPGCPPDTPRIPVVDDYHGVKVTDDYRWLETWSDPKVKAWSEAQNACTRAYLEALPGREILKERFTTLLGGASPDYFDLKIVRGTLFAMKEQPPKQQPFLVTLNSAGEPGGARVVVDTNSLDPSGITAIDWYEPSPDGKLVAVSLSVGGSENGAIHVYDVATGKPVYEIIERAQEGTGGGALVWDRAGKGFFYTRYPRGAERPKEDLDFYQQVYHHTLGTPDSQDVYSIGKEWPRIAETTFKRGENGVYILAVVANGDGGQFAFYLQGPSRQWSRVADFSDEVKRAEFGPGPALYLLCTKDAPRGKVFRVPLSSPDLVHAVVVVPPSAAVVEECVPAASLLYVRDLIGGPSRIRVFSPQGKELGEVPAPPVSGVSQMVRSGENDLLFRSQSYLTPPAWYLYEAKSWKVTKTALATASPADFSDTEAVRIEATSKDGAKVPLTILMRKGTPLDGTSPAILEGYGGFSVSETPRFSASRRAWIEQGGIIARASIRGGGEFGEEWHQAGNLTRKQNCFDDFEACARTLVQKKYTSAARLAIMGGSNGGLLMGAELTQHPDLCAAVVSYVGLYDMLRVELSPNGSFNVTEFGTVKDPVQFKALFAYSPYQHVGGGTAYPASLFLTGANDPRVDPMQSRKFVARLQAANASKRAILLRTSGNSGHGIDMALSELIGEEVDVYAFLFHELGVTVKPVRGAKGP